MALLLCLTLLVISCGPKPNPTPATSDVAPTTTEAAGTPEPGTPESTEPGVTDPGVTDPGVTDPGVTDPGVTEPVVNPNFNTTEDDEKGFSNISPF